MEFAQIEINKDRIESLSKKKLYDVETNYRREGVTQLKNQMRVCRFMLKRTTKGMTIPTVSEKEIEQKMTTRDAEIMIKIIEHRKLTKDEQEYLLKQWRKSLQEFKK